MGYVFNPLTSSLDKQRAKATITSITTGTKTPSATNNYHALTNNSLTLSPGRYELSGILQFDASGSPSYTVTAAGWYGANGDDTPTVPADIAGVTGLTVLSSYVAHPTGLAHYNTLAAQADKSAMPSIIIECTQEVTVYLVTFANMATPSAARITAYITAKSV